MHVPYFLKTTDPCAFYKYTFIYYDRTGGCIYERKRRYAIKSYVLSASFTSCSADKHFAKFAYIVYKLNLLCEQDNEEL